MVFTQSSHFIKRNTVLLVWFICSLDNWRKPGMTWTGLYWTVCVGSRSFASYCSLAFSQHIHILFLFSAGLLSLSLNSWMRTGTGIYYTCYRITERYVKLYQRLLMETADSPLFLSRKLQSVVLLLSIVVSFVCFAHSFILLATDFPGHNLS